ncbi:MAG: hypothetical protein EHM48_05845 [Planctomycetaceae bacterium]|nr:MAG: hypothetical protein EHM48_05845 [Planctomycetaceae bacterium]
MINNTLSGDVVSITPSRNGYQVVYSALFNGERDTWRAYETTETVDEIKAYVAATYPKLNPLFVVTDA